MSGVGEGGGERKVLVDASRFAFLEEAESRLTAEVETLRDENARLREMVKELKERVGQNSSNSSRPPSSDSDGDRSRKGNGTGKKPGGRKPGGQPGHERNTRPLVPPEQVDESVVIKPEKCWKCGKVLTGDDPSPLRHQVAFLPRVKVIVREWLLHALECECGAVTRADIPEGVPRGGFCQRLIAAVALLTGGFRLSKRNAQELLAILFGAPMALGSVSNCERTVSDAVSPAVQVARQYVKEQSVKHADETSWFEGAKRLKVWLWVVTTPLVTVFKIKASRGSQVARDMLGKIFGVLVSDRWSGYSWWPLQWRQLCWAHIKRHFQAFIDAGGEAARIGTELQEERRKLFEFWYRVRDGTPSHLERSSFRTKVSPIRQRIRELLGEGAQCSHSKTATTCRELLKMEPAMYTFVRVPGVEPTNNSGERQIRFGVIWRKTCFGTHSQAGSRFVERMLTVRQTLRQQGRDVLDFLEASVRAHQFGGDRPSLLPGN